MTFSEKLVQFVTKHWLLSVAFLIGLIALFVMESRAKGGVGRQVSIHEAINLINREDALIIDTRDAENFNNGHISGARNIPADQIDQMANKLSAFKERPVIVVCYKGQSSIAVVNKLRKLGFTNVRSLTGGMQAWVSASMPVKKGKK